jgi:hypothetical protein
LVPILRSKERAVRQIRKRLTYANVMSSLAVFLVVAGGAAFAATQLPKNSVGTKQLKKGAVKTSKLGTKTVKTGKLAKDAVSTSRIQDNAVSTPKIAVGSILTDRIAQDAVTSDKMAADAVTGTELADDSVTSTKIAAGSVTQEELATGSVGAAQLRDITVVSATSAAVANGVSAGATASCPAGEVVISGGFETQSLGAASWEIKRLVRSGNGWRVFGTNISGGNSTITAFAYCMGA